MTPNTAKARRTLLTPPVASSPFPLNPGSLLSCQDLPLEALSHLLARATALENQDPLTRARILAKRRIAAGMPTAVNPGCPVAGNGPP